MVLAACGGDGSEGAPETASASTSSEPTTIATTAATTVEVTTTTAPPPTTAVEVTTTTALPPTSTTTSSTTTAPPPMPSPATTASSAPPTSTTVPLIDDPIAAWPAPPGEPASLDDPPYLLPTVAIPGVDEGRRSESEPAAPAETADYLQIWVNTDGSARLNVLTHVGQTPFNPDGLPLDVEPWDLAFAVPSAPGYINVTLGDPSGYVTLNGQNLDRSEVERIGRSLSPRPGAPGWEIDEGELDLFHEGWVLPPATRSMDWFGNGRRVAEIGIYEYIPGTITFGDPADSETSLAQLGDTTAVVVERGDGVSAPALSIVSWSPAPNITVRFAATLPVDETLEIVRSISSVDRATWDAVSRPAPPSDGCQSLIC